MKRRSAVVGAMILSFSLGILLSQSIGFSVSEGGSVDEPAVDLPAAALKAWFPPVGEYDTGGEPLDDELFASLMEALEEAMTADETLADFEREAKIQLRNFMRRLAIPEVPPSRRRGFRATSPISPKSIRTTGP